MAVYASMAVCLEQLAVRHKSGADDDELGIKKELPEDGSDDTDNEFEKGRFTYGSAKLPGSIV